MFISPLSNILSKSGADFSETAGWQQIQSFGDPEAELRGAREAVVLADLSASTKILVEGERAAEVVQAALNVDATALPVGVGLDAGAFGAYRLRQDQVFVHGTPEQADLMAALQRSAGSGRPFTTVTDLTHGRAEVAVIGPQAAELLSRLCGLDFSEASFPNLNARQSSVAKTSQLILRHDRAGIPAYALIGDRSLGAYLWQTALQAGADLGIAAAGLQSLAKLAENN
jgi:heterotetrameric sarcosine oxidase gamma subunit